MFRIEKETADGIDKISLIGAINEDVDFNQMIGKLLPHAQINCRQVTRLNSMGIKMWCLYFQGLREAGVDLKFYECVPALVEQCNFLSNLILTKEIVSVCLRYICPKCDQEHTAVGNVEELKKANMAVPRVQCSTCKVDLEFDEIPSQYFSFIRRA